MSTEVLEHVTTVPDTVPGVPLADAIEAVPDLTRYQPMTARELEDLLGPPACRALVECFMAGTVQLVSPDRYQGCEPPPEGRRRAGMVRGMAEVRAAAVAASAAREAEKAERRKARKAAA